jgi:hypothetical protein
MAVSFLAFARMASWISPLELAVHPVSGLPLPKTAVIVVCAETVGASATARANADTNLRMVRIPPVKKVEC